MKKGFTMIELIFVIVILGILAAVAIPRLAATRDDAEVVKLGTNLTTLLGDVGAYYTSQGGFPSGYNVKQMSNVTVTGGTDLTAGVNLQVAGEDCVNIVLTDADADTNTPAYVTVTKTGTGKLCNKAAALKSVDDVINASFNYKKLDKTNGTYTDTKLSNAYAISGINVQF